MPAIGPLGRYGRYLAVAFEFSGAVMAGATVGWLLDRWLGTQPIGLLICVVFAAVGGIVRLALLLRQLDRLDERR